MTNFYSDLQEAMLQFIVRRRLYSKLKGNEAWKLMERSRACPGRTWQSLKENFRRQVMPQVGTYSLPPIEVSRIRRGWDGQTVLWVSDDDEETSSTLSTSEDSAPAREAPAKKAAPVAAASSARVSPRRKRPIAPAGGAFDSSAENAPPPKSKSPVPGTSKGADKDSPGKRAKDPPPAAKKLRRMLRDVDAESAVFLTPPRTERSERAQRRRRGSGQQHQEEQEQDKQSEENDRLSPEKEKTPSPVKGGGARRKGRRRVSSSSSTSSSSSAKTTVSKSGPKSKAYTAAEDNAIIGFIMANNYFHQVRTTTVFNI